MGVLYIGGTGFLDNRTGDWFINGYSLGEITVAGGGSIDHTGAANPFAIFMDSTATGGTYGVLNLAGGTVTVGARSIQFGNSTTNGSGNTGFINLAAGTLSVGAVMASSVNAAGGNNVYLNFAGGTLKNSANVSNWIPGSTAGITYNATLFGSIDNSAATGDTSQNFAGGLTVDTNGFTSSLSNVFNPASGAGVTQANLTVNGGSGYVGAPAVIFSTAGVVAGGTPAAGYALISGGQVVGIVITSPGTYAPGTVPAITLTGGGGTGASVTAAALNTANVGAGLTKIGNGTLTLSGTNTFTAPLTINAGAVASATFNNIGVNGPLGAGIATSTATNAASIVLNGGALSYAGAAATSTDRLVTVTANGGEIDSTSTTAANTITFSNTNGIAYSGAGVRALTFGGANTGLNTFQPVIGDANAGADAVTVTKIGAGKWLLTAANAYTGGTNIAGGILAFDSGTLGSTGNITFTGNSTLQWDGTNTQDVSARLVLTSGVTGTIDTNGNNLVFANGIGIVGGTAGVLAKTGAGSLTLNGASSHSGGTTLTAGTLNIGNASALGTGTFTIGAGTIFDNTTGAPLALAANNVQAWNGDFTFTGTDSLDMGNGAVTLSAARTVTITANTLTVGGAIGGLFALTKNGNGTLYLSGNSTFGAAAGSTVTINGGVLKIDSEAGLGNVLNDVTFAGGTTLEVTTGFTANAGKIFNFTAAGGATVQVDSGTMTIPSALTGTAGTGGLIKTGAGTLALSGANTAYDAQGVGLNGATGVGFRVDQGTLLLQGSSNGVVGDINPTSMTMQLNGGDLTIQTDTPSIARANLYVSSTATLTADNATAGVGILQVIGTGTGAQLTMGTGSSVLNIVGGANVTGGTEIVQFGATTLLAAPTFHIVNPAGATTQLTLGAITGGTFTTTLTGNGNFTQTGAIASSGGFTLDATYSGLATLSQANTYSAPTAINGGTLAFSASNNLGDASVTNQIAMAGSTFRYTGTGTTDLTSNRQVNLATSTTNTIEVTASTGILQATGGIVTTGAANLVKTGLGVFAVTGPVNLHGGNVTVSDGTLAAGFTATGAKTITVSGTGSLQLIDGSASTLTLASSAGALTLNAGARVGFELAASGSSDTIVIGSGGSALTSGGTITLDFYALSGFGAGNYTVLQADGGLLQGGVTYVLGTAPTGFNYILTQTDTQVSLTTSVLSNRYWTGTQGNSWTTLNAGPASNFSTDAAGTIDAGAIPGAADTVIFSAGTVASTAISTTLDAAFTIDSLQFLNVPATVATVTIAPGTGGSLTISPVSTSNGITVAANGGVVSITAPLTALTPQTWSVDGTGSSALTINGNITFTAAVTKTGNGILTLTGNNTGAGGLTLTGGTLRINSATALGAGPFTIGAGTTIDNTASVALVLSTNNAENWNGSFTFTGGTHSLDMGTGTVTLGNSLTVTSAGLSLTIGGAIGDGGNTRSLTKAGAGILILNGNNTYDGLTTVSAGILTLGGNNSGATGGVTIIGGTLNLGAATALGTGAFTIGGGIINNTSGSTLTLSTNNPQNWNGNFTFTGTNALNLGTGAVTLGAAVTATITANTLTVGGVIDGGVGIVKDGAGTLSLGAANTYLGGTTINNGTLTFTASQSLTAITNNLTFGNAAGSASLGTMNLNSASATFGGAMNVQTNSTTANLITIGSGQTLLLNGAVKIGYDSGGNTNTKLTASGLGTLSVGTAGTATNAGFTIGGSITSTFSNAVTLDLSALAVFYANLGSGTFRLGDITNTGGQAVSGSTLILAANSTIITATLSSDSPDSGATQALKLGSGTNIINATTINIGAGPSGRSSGTLVFNTGTGTLTIRDLAGTGRAAMTVASGATGTGAAFTGTVNLVGHSVYLLLGTLSIGSRSSGNAGLGDTTGTFSFDTGILDVTTITLANRTGSVPTVAIDTGTLNFMATGGSGTVTVSALNMAVNSASSATTSGPAVATLNIGGTGTVGITTLTMANDSIGGGATAQPQNPVQSTVNISGSTTTITTLNMNVNSSANTGTNNASLSTLNISGGTVHIGTGGLNMANASNAAATATSAINLNGGTLTLGGNLTYTAGAGHGKHHAQSQWRRRDSRPGGIQYRDGHERGRFRHGLAPHAKGHVAECRGNQWRRCVDQDRRGDGRAHARHLQRLHRRGIGGRRRASHHAGKRSRWRDQRHLRLRRRGSRNFQHHHDNCGGADLEWRRREQRRRPAQHVRREHLRGCDHPRLRCPGQLGCRHTDARCGKRQRDQWQLRRDVWRCRAGRGERRDRHGRQHRDQGRHGHADPRRNQQLHRPHRCHRGQGDRQRFPRGRCPGGGRRDDRQRKQHLCGHRRERGLAEQRDRGRHSGAG